MDKQVSTLGIVGAGCIGRRIAQAVEQGELDYRLAAVYDTDSTAAQRLIDDIVPDAIKGEDLADVMRHVDVVVECAAASAVPGIFEAASWGRKHHGRPAHMLVMSVGGLLDTGNLYRDSADSGLTVHIPSGALGGLDAIQALAVAGLTEVRLTSRKPPAGLGLELTEEEVLFEGSAADVIKKYPKNVNVAIALSFAGLGPDRTQVKLVADPMVSRNTHHVIAKGNAGEVEFTSRNEPFPENPRTSHLAALSAIAMLKRLSTTVQVG